MHIDEANSRAAAQLLGAQQARQRWGAWYVFLGVNTRFGRYFWFNYVQLPFLGFNYITLSLQQT